MMTGWEVYAPGWVCKTETDLRWLDKYHAILDSLYLNSVLIDVCHPLIATVVVFIRQPEDKDSVAMRLRMQNCANVIKRQWMQAIYNPARVICRRQQLQGFQALDADVMVKTSDQGI